MTVAGYDCAYRSFRRFLLEAVPRTNGAIGTRLSEVEAWLMWLRKRGVGPVSCNTYWRGLVPFFQYLERTRSVPNPFDGLRAPGLPQRVPKALSPDECRRLIESAQHFPWPTLFERTRAVAVVAILLYTGLRRGELLRLKYADVDLNDGSLRVEKGKGRYGGKDRVCVLPPELIFFLKAYLRERARCQIVCPEVFASHRQQGLSETQLRRILGAVKRAAGIQFSPHALRHSFISMALRAGTPIHVVQALAGHASIQSTIPYIRVFDEERRAAAQKFTIMGL
ncbi:MAG: Tyrosine recombinase XerC [Thermoanaerobaculia bacterium]|nr:Tyrosine recombinase XerC [Thermoanaerobaculia bacterium]